MTKVNTVIADGHEWRLFSAEYDTADGKFAFDFYAISREHAEMMLAELKATARLCGEITDIIPG